MPAFNLDVFCRTVQDHQITFTYVAPPVIVQLSRGKNVSKYDLSSLRMITSGAAPLTRELVDTVYSKYQLKINQAYGLSETSPMTHTQVCLHADRVESPSPNEADQIECCSHGTSGTQVLDPSANCFRT